MFRWFSKRSSSAPTATEAPVIEPPAPVMRQIPPARPAVPPGSTPPTLESLIARLTSSDHETRVNVARELGRRGDRTAVPALIAALQDVHSAVRVAVAHALGKLHDERAIEALAAGLAEDNATARAAARNALEAIGTSRAQDALAGHDARTAQLAREAEARAEPTAERGVEEWIEALRGGDERLHAPAADALAEAGPAAIERLVPLLADENVWVRTRAAELLGRISDNRAAQPLAAALDAISREDRSYETYQFRDALRRALASVSPPPPLTASRTEAAPTEVSVTSQPDVPMLVAPAATESPTTITAALGDLTDQQLGERLLEIARAAVGGGNPPLDTYDGRRDAARVIGQALHARGGLDAMHVALDDYVGRLPGRHPIEQAWDGVGEWRG